MKLSKQILPNYFTIGTPNNSHYIQPTNCLEFVDRQSKTLFVTIGDSWTWGSELDDPTNQAWGNHVSHHFAWDWLNLSLPGTSNFFMADWAEELAKITNELEYESILTICLFTEIGRGFNSHHDQHIDYNKWFSQNCYNPQDFRLFLEMINQDCVTRILRASQDRYKVWFGSNFVDHLGLPPDLTLPTPWIRLLGLHSQKNIYASRYGVKRLQEAKEFLPPEKIVWYKYWLSEMIDDAEIISYLCARCAPGKTEAHPDEAGHKIWANYVIEFLNTHDNN